MASRYRRLLGYVLRQRNWLLAIFFLTLSSSAAAALQPWPMKLLVDDALGDAGIPQLLRFQLERMPSWEPHMIRSGAADRPKPMARPTTTTSTRSFKT